MPQESIPPISKKRCITFFDGQNLYMAAKQAFGYTHPNYDVSKLSQKIAEMHGCYVSQINFYTGIAAKSESVFWHEYWSKKLAVMGTRGINKFTRPVRYSKEKFTLSDGTIETVATGREKGIDVRIALDVVRLAIKKSYDVAVIFSQDQDLSEVADEVKMISKQQSRTIEIVSAYPSSSMSENKRGIEKTQWFQIDRDFYDQCIDPNDYRPKTFFNPLIPK